MSAPDPVIDVEQVMREIRERAHHRSGAVSHATYGSASDPASHAPDFAWLRQSVMHVSRCAGLLGEMPPAPSTWRAGLGAVLVRLVRRMLFWYTPQITQFQGAAARSMHEQVAAMERLAEMLQQARASADERLDDLEEQIRELRLALESNPRTEPPRPRSAGSG
jgi:hypothetical protein